MIVLGYDPSLTGFGWAVYDSEATGKDRCPERGRWKTTTKQDFVDRFVELGENVYDLNKRIQPDKVGVESPSFGANRSETMFALFTHVNASIKRAGYDVAFFAPLQVKAHPRLFLKRPPKWKMMKMDMVEAAKKDTGGKGRWNGDSADAYWVSWITERFFSFFEGKLTAADLNEIERHQFLHTHTFVRGLKKGITERKGLVYRERDRFFRWSMKDVYGKESIISR